MPAGSSAYTKGSWPGGGSSRGGSSIARVCSSSRAPRIVLTWSRKIAVAAHAEVASRSYPHEQVTRQSR